jgi:hypothetical protein
MTSIEHIQKLIDSLRVIEGMLDCSGSAMTPSIHGKASALVSIARMDAQGALRLALHDIRYLERKLAEATNTEEAYYARRAKEMAE